MKSKYKSKMRQKQRERARMNRAESKESNKPKTTSAEPMRKLREPRKAETSGVAREPGVASTSRAAQAMDIQTRIASSPPRAKRKVPSIQQDHFVSHIIQLL
jgi:hypothetical protein